MIITGPAVLGARLSGLGSKMYSSNKQRMQHILNKDLTLPPLPPPPFKKKKIISIVLNLSWDDCNTQKK